MKSQGEIEAAVCDGISRFQQEFIGRGPRDIHAHLVGTLLVVRLQGVLTPAERQLISPRPGPAGNGGPAAEAGTGNGFVLGHTNGDNGRALLKQIRSHMVATGRPRLEEIVRGATGVEMGSDALPSRAVTSPPSSAGRPGGRRGRTRSPPRR